jgi:hypothetical protein
MTHRYTLIIMALGLIAMTSCTSPVPKSPTAITPVVTDTKYKVGQIWAYDHRHQDDSSTITILRIEKYPKGDTIVHIMIDHVHMHNTVTDSDYVGPIAHMPFSAKALSASFTKVLGQSDSLPDYLEGYTTWREAWDSSKGGYWTTSPREAVEGINQVSRQKK